MNATPALRLSWHSLLSRPAALTLSALLLAGCSMTCADDEALDGYGAVASAVLEAKSGSQLSGWARFVERQGGVAAIVHVEGAAPGWHAVHVHEHGDCSSEDGKSAGGHFNPGATEHGSPHAPTHHAGDLGNMWVAEDGVGHHEIFMPELTVTGGAYSVVGRGLIVHAGADDLVSQPTGAAGGRIGCGVIR